MLFPIGDDPFGRSNPDSRKAGQFLKGCLINVNFHWSRWFHSIPCALGVPVNVHQKAQKYKGGDNPERVLHAHLLEKITVVCRVSEGVQEVSRQRESLISPVATYLKNSV